MAECDDFETVLDRLEELLKAGKARYVQDDDGKICLRLDDGKTFEFGPDGPRQVESAIP